MVESKSYIEYKTAYEIFDTDRDGVIDIQELSYLMKSFGVELSKDENENLFYESCSKDIMKIRFNDFLKLMNKKNKELDMYDEYVEAFKIFSEDDNKISLEALEQILRNLGENLTDEEIEQFILEANVKGDGNIEFREFIKLMLCK